MVISERGLDASVMVSCDPGYRLLGPAEYRCGGDSTWQPPFDSSCELSNIGESLCPSVRARS